MTKDVLHKLTHKDDEIELARAAAILNISKFVKEHPRAREAELQKKVQEEIAVFTAKIQHL